MTTTTTVAPAPTNTATRDGNGGGDGGGSGFGCGAHREAPAGLSVEHAHTVMQQHLRCVADPDPARRAALGVLITSGRVVPAGHHWPHTTRRR